jgi:nucleotide-binding universal stress UspA family protein
MKILIAVDGSKFTKKMLAYMATHSELFGQANSYSVLTVQPHLPGRARKVVGAEVVKDYYREEAAAILKPVCAFLLRHGINPESTSKVGAPGETIAKFAENGKFDLILMGSHGHGGLAKLVMGSVSTEVLAHSKIPVLLVR